MISYDRLSHIDDQPLGRLLFPGDESELSDMLAEATADKHSIIPIGGGTHLSWGNPPFSAEIGMVLNGMNRILDYRPEDLLVTVQPGCRFSILQERLAEHKQCLPIDPYATSESTIGGLIAINAYGPMRLQHGRWRDHILGMRVVTAGGTRTRCGGQVVKNVSGYDLSKFYTGSLGWLGIFSEFHLKTTPLPEYRRSGIFVAGDFSVLHNLGQSILKNGLQPLSMALSAKEFLASPFPGIIPDGRWGLAIAYAGHQETVRWQWDQTLQLASSSAAIKQLFFEDGDAHCLWKNISGFGWEPMKKNSILLKAILPYTQTAEIWNQLDEAFRQIDWSFQGLCYAGSHLSWLLLTPMENREPAWEKPAFLLNGLRRQLRLCRGELILAYGPRPIKDLFEVWGVQGKNLELMLQIKDQLDPAHLLNPGRFVGRQ
jgi:glycolate oxidase FAD binding subunit